MRPVGTCGDAVEVASREPRDGSTVLIAVHDLGGSGTGTPMLLSHATGFCAHVWEPFAAALADHHRCFALDYRGYGDAEKVSPESISWEGFAADAAAAAHHVREMTGSDRVIGVGHSMGGAALVSAAIREPDLFRALFVYEPIIFPPMPVTGERHGGNILADGARRRRRTFESMEAALANYAAKPPMSGFDARAREGYVRQGFRVLEDSTVELKCDPELEARTYETSAQDPKWEDLGKVPPPVWVMAGVREQMQPSAMAEPVAERMREGGARAVFVRWDELGHFGPLEDPTLVAGFVARTTATLPSATMTTDP
jgi:pimeloyl-ACP methyl ester carboxylesterase